MNKVLVRTISGIGFVLVMLAGLLVNKYVFTALVAFLMLGMICEVVKISVNVRDRLTWRMLWLLTIVLYGACLFFLGFIKGEFSGKLLLCIYVMIWSSDVGAYCTGSLLGQKAGSRKLAPNISPNKSWAGFWGGLAFTVAASLILHYFGMLSFPAMHCLIIAVIVHCAGVCGDLAESKFKRRCGVKDSGTLIPGHGGLLDRLDSSMAAIPAAFLYMLILKLL